MKTTAHSIVELPESIKKCPSRTAIELLQETGYMKESKGITTTLIKRELELRPELVDSWLNWSADKRTTTGWFFIENDDATFAVGYFPGDKPTIYHDRNEACAVFIKHELDQLATSGLE